MLQTLTSPSGLPKSGFGFSIAVEGSAVAVGAPYETSGGRTEAGNAYVFTLSPPGTVTEATTATVATTASTVATALTTSAPVSHSTTTTTTSKVSSGSSSSSFSPSSLTTTTQESPSTSSYPGGSSSEIPEFPFQLSLATFVTFAVVVVYALARRAARKVGRCSAVQRSPSLNSGFLFPQRATSTSDD